MMNDVGTREGSGFAPVKWLVWAMIAVLLIGVVRHEHDIDESQNLHLSYGWVVGEIPYRDRFDNHAPLFAMGYAPVAWIAGETEWIVAWARLALVPLWLGILWLVFQLARRLGTAESAWWTLAICLVFADWSLKLIEFRPDVLWALAWFLGLLAVLRAIERPRLVLAFFAGLCFGVALCASIKTTFLAPSLALACGLGWWVSPTVRAAIPVRRLPGFLGLGVLGFIVPPAILFGGFLWAGTPLDLIKFCLVEINKLPFETARIWIAVALLPGVVALGWKLFRDSDVRGSERGIVVVASGIYLLLLLAFAPEMRKQTFLVVTPLVVAALCGFAFERLPRQLTRVAAGLVCIGFAVHFVIESRLWRDGLAEHRALLAEVLQLTERGDMILDGRGETIFGDRPYYLAFVEIITAKIDRDDLPQPDPEAVFEAKTTVAIGELDGLPESLRPFVKQNFVKSDSGRLRVAGKILTPEWEDGRWIERTSVGLPGNYVIVQDGQIVGKRTIDQPGLQAIDLGSNRDPALLILEDPWLNGFRPDEESSLK